MVGLADLEAARDTLLRALYGSETRVRFPDGSEVTYRSVEEIRQALADLERRMAGAQGRRPISVVRIGASKGL